MGTLKFGYEANNPYRVPRKTKSSRNMIPSGHNVTYSLEHKTSNQ